jgi:hypothetical protein
MIDRWNKKVCFIAGAGHSGSTLLGLLLGSHSSSFYAGEAVKTKYLHNHTKLLHKRVCKFCGIDCPLWGNFFIQPSPDLYEQISQRVKRSLIIDSTKEINWLKVQIDQLLNINDITVFLIFLQRDGRAVVNSQLRKYPDRSPRSIIEKWQRHIHQTKILFDQFPSPKTIVQYEELATQPAIIIQQLCTFLQIRYEPEMLNYSQVNHHVLGGNNGTQFLVAQAQKQEKAFVTLSDRSRDYYSHHDDQIRLDLRWKTELSPAIQSLFASLVGTDNHGMQWGE